MYRCNYLHTSKKQPLVENSIRNRLQNLDQLAQGRVHAIGGLAAWMLQLVRSIVSTVRNGLAAVWDNVLCRGSPVNRLSGGVHENTNRLRRNQKKCRGFFIVIFVIIVVPIAFLVYGTNRAGPTSRDQPAQSTQPVVHIIQSDNRNLSDVADDYQTLTAIINFRYAQRHGYQYTRYQFTSSDTSGHPKTADTCGGRAAPWCKIISAYHALQSMSDGDWIMFVDSDAAFFQFNTSIEQYISSAQYEQNRSDPSMILTHNFPWSFPPACTGLWMLRADKVGRDILTEWWNCPLHETGYCKKFFHQHTFEMRHFNEVILPRYTDNISIWKDYSFGSKWRKGYETLWWHIGSKYRHERVSRFTELLNATTSPDVDIKSVVETIRSRTVRLADGSPAQIELETRVGNS